MFRRPSFRLRGPDACRDPVADEFALQLRERGQHVLEDARLRTLIPAISAASVQLIFFAIAFKFTSCNFIIRSISGAGIV